LDRDWDVKLAGVGVGASVQLGALQEFVNGEHAGAPLPLESNGEPFVDHGLPLSIGDLALD
jgi:hypothetical protein